MGSWEDRMRLECDELSEKVHALNKFIGGEIYNELMETDQDFLVLQLSAMNTYLGILAMRIDRIDRMEQS